MPEELYWRSTPYEMRLLLKAWSERKRAEAEADNLRAGLVASAVYNVNRKRGSQPIKPQDFLPKKLMTPEQQRQAMLQWAMTRKETDE